MKYLAPLAFLTFGFLGCLIYLVVSSDFEGSAWLNSQLSDGGAEYGSDALTTEASAELRIDPLNPNQLSASSPKLVLMKFGAPWCPPCRMIDKELRKLDRTDLPVEIRKINVDERPDMASRYGVSSIPRLILLQDGRKIGDAVGYQSADDLADWINENASAAALAGKKRSDTSSVVQANPFFN